MNFKTFLTEAYKNLFTKEDKEKWLDEVFDILQSSYAAIGGIKTNGIKTKEEALTSPLMWKISVRDGKVKTATIYKDDGTGRKMVLVGTDGSKEAKTELKKIVYQDLFRSYGEISDDLEKFITRNFPKDIKKFSIPNTEVCNQLKFGEFKIPETDNDGFHYDRKIGKHWHRKLMIGTPGKRITGLTGLVSC